MSTHDSLLTYQAANGLRADGMAGGATRLVLRRSLDAPAAPEEVLAVDPVPGPEGLLRLGDNGAAVENIQGLLIELGHLDGSVDGAFGPGTEAAVVSFQLRFGLEADGVVGGGTIEVFERIENFDAVPLRYGDQSDAVALAQDLLRGAGEFPGPSVGIFGPRTLEAVIAFQIRAGLGADGIIGPATAQALGLP